MKPSKRIYLQIILIFIVVVFSALFAFPKGPNWLRDEIKLHLGLDLAGGAHLVYQADVSEIKKDYQEFAVSGTRDVIEQRVNALGVSEPIVQTNKTDAGYRIIVEMPGITDVNQAIERIGDTPVLEFKELAPPEPLTAEEKAQREEFNQSQKQKAEEILATVINAPDEEFAKTAKEFSQDPGSKEQGGDLGFMQKESLVPEFAEVIFDKLTDQETYDQIVETQFGYHIIRRLQSRCVNTETQEIVDCSQYQEDIKDKNLKIIKEVRSRHILFSKQSLDVKAPKEQWRNTKLSGEHLEKAILMFDQKTGFPIVNLQFNKEGSNFFEQITERNIQKQVAIFLDGQIISAPKVNEKITGGNAVISGDFTINQAQELTKRLNAGALPVNIKLISQQRIGPSLGKMSVQKSFLAGVLGLFLVMLFMIFYYRLPGLIAAVALIIYSLILISIFKLIPIVLTLSGIAGFILTIGLAVDANVLIFERIKEELRSGKTLQAAIDEGFARAWVCIRDSNISTLITAFILMWLGKSMIKGFGITLCIGILISMFTAITVTRVLLKIIAKHGKTGNWWWGV